MGDDNGMSIIKKLAPMAGIIIATILATIFLISRISAAQGCAERANVRVDSLEKRFDQFERVQMRHDDKLDKILIHVKR